jgi:hypothetical protein
VTLSRIGGDGGLEVYAAEYPLAGPTEGLWTQWGQGIALANGIHLSAVGNHLGVEGDAWFYTYDPATRELTRIGDVLSLMSYETGSFGYGKVHAQMMADRCGSVWAATYWGTRTDLEYQGSYEGDLLIQIDPSTRTIASYGPVFGQRGVPTMVMAPDGQTLVASSVDSASDTATLTVVDTETRSVDEVVDDPAQVLFRALGVGTDSGLTMYAIGDGGLGLLDPATGKFSHDGPHLPGAEMRAITRSASDGTVYGVTDEESALFAIRPGQEVESLGSAGGYTASLGMTPDGSRIFWLPDAHGGAWESGARVRQMDTASGDVTDLVGLEDLFTDSLSLHAGGTYSVVYDDGRLILGVNASPLDDDSGFGTVVLVVIEGV